MELLNGRDAGSERPMMPNRSGASSVPPPRLDQCNCSIFSGWRGQPQVRFSCISSAACAADCSQIGCFSSVSLVGMGESERRSYDDLIGGTPSFVSSVSAALLPRVSARSASRSQRSAKRLITAAVLLSFSSLDDSRISAARSRRWVDSLTLDAGITDAAWLPKPWRITSFP